MGRITQRSRAQRVSKMLDKGRRLELALKKKNIKKSQLADRMGKSRQHVNGWCKNGAYSLETLELILTEINMSLSAFFNISEG